MFWHNVSAFGAFHTVTESSYLFIYADAMLLELIFEF